MGCSKDKLNVEEQKLNTYRSIDCGQKDSFKVLVHHGLPEMIDNVVPSACCSLGRDIFLLYLLQLNWAKVPISPFQAKTARVFTTNLSMRDIYFKFYKLSYILPSK